jgi:hypothetical protein
MERLESLLVDMLRSALAWEQEHGQPSQSMTINGLTGLAKPDKLQTPGIKKAGEKHDHTRASQK